MSTLNNRLSYEREPDLYELESERNFEDFYKFYNDYSVDDELYYLEYSTKKIYYTY